MKKRKPDEFDEYMRNLMSGGGKGQEDVDRYMRRLVYGETDEETPDPASTMTPVVLPDSYKTGAGQDYLNDLDLFGQGSAGLSPVMRDTPPPVTEPVTPPVAEAGVKTPTPEPKPLPKGLITEGNLDLNKRPVVPRDDGKISTVNSITVGFDDGFYVLPTVTEEGLLLDNDQAVEYFKKTGKHLGRFYDQETADAFAQQLHLDQEKMYGGQGETKSPGIFTELVEKFSNWTRENEASTPYVRGQEMGGPNTRLNLLDAIPIGDRDPLDLGKAISNIIPTYQDITGAEDFGNALGMRYAIDDAYGGKDEPLVSTRDVGLDLEDNLKLAQLRLALKAGDMEEANRLKAELEESARKLEESSKARRDWAERNRVNYEPAQEGILKYLQSGIENTGFSAMARLRSLPAWVLGGPALGAMTSYYNAAREGAGERGEKALSILKENPNATRKELEPGMEGVMGGNLALLTVSEILGDTLLLSGLWPMIGGGKALAGPGAIKAAGRFLFNKGLPYISQLLTEYPEEFGQQLLQQLAGRGLSFSDMWKLADVAKAHEAGLHGIAGAVVSGAGGVVAKPFFDSVRQGMSSRENENPDVLPAEVGGADEVLKHLKDLGFDLDLADLQAGGAPTGGGQVGGLLHTIINELSKTNPQLAQDVLEASRTMTPEEASEAAGILREQINNNQNETDVMDQGVVETEAPKQSDNQGATNTTVATEKVVKDLSDAYASGYVDDAQLYEAGGTLDAQLGLTPGTTASNIRAGLASQSTVTPADPTVPVAESGETSAKPAKPKLTRAQKIVQKLKESQGRGDALAILGNRKGEFLSEIAGELGIPVDPSDTPATLRNKIIESTAGENARALAERAQRRIQEQQGQGVNVIPPSGRAGPSPTQNFPLQGTPEQDIQPPAPTVQTQGVQSVQEQREEQQPENARDITEQPIEQGTAEATEETVEETVEEDPDYPEITELRSASDPKEAYNVAKKISKARLREVAERLGIEINDKKDTVNTLRDRIVEVISGEREAQTPDVGTEQDTTETPTQTPVQEPAPVQTPVPKQKKGKSLGNVPDMTGGPVQETTQPKGEGLVIPGEKRLGDQVTAPSQDLSGKVDRAQLSKAKTEDSAPTSEAVNESLKDEIDQIIDEIRNAPADKESRLAVLGKKTKKQLKAVSERLGVTMPDSWKAPMMKDAILDLVHPPKKTVQAMDTSVYKGRLETQETTHAPEAKAEPTPAPVKAETPSQVKAVAEKINNAKSRGEVKQNLEGLKKKELVAVAKELGVVFGGSDTINTLKETIEAQTIGVREQARTFRDIDLRSDIEKLGEDNTPAKDNKVPEVKAPSLPESRGDTAITKTQETKKPSTKYRTAEEIKRDADSIDEANKANVTEFDEKAEPKEEKSEPKVENKTEEKTEPEVKSEPKSKAEESNPEEVESKEKQSKEKRAEPDIELNKRITFATLKKAFPKERVFNLGKGVFRIVGRNGQTAHLVLAKRVDIDPVAYERENGKPPTQEMLDAGALGSTTRLVDGTTLIQIAADMTMTAENINDRFKLINKETGKTVETTRGTEMVRTIFHESYHAASDMVLSNKEKSILSERYGNEEAQADAYMDWLLRREMKSTTGRIFQRIFDFFSRVRSSLLGPNSESVFVNINRGQAWARESGAKKGDTSYRIQGSLRLDDESLSPKDKELLQKMDEYINWEPQRTKDGKILGAPEWVKTDKDLKKLRKLLKQFVDEGISARYWYEDSGLEVLRMVGGNVEDAAMFTQILAIYSPKNKVDNNTTAAIKAWNMYKRGVPESEFHVATSVQDQKAKNVLYHGDKWEGRKTGSFYSNLMFEILKDNPELAESLGIDTDKLKATIDLWMYRAFGYINEQGSNDQKYGRYTFAESSLIRLAAELNRGRKPGEPIWTPHQVQAAIWTAMKTRYENALVKKSTNELGLKQGIITMKDGKPVYPKEGTPERKQHLQNWREFALEIPDSAWVKEEAERTGVSFAEYIKRMTEHITLEVIPSSKFNAEINNASAEVRRAFTERVMGEIILDENGNDQIAQLLDVPISRVEIGDGANDGGVNPNIIASLTPDKVREYDSQGNPKTTLVFNHDNARAYSRIVQYVFKQDAVPWFNPNFVPLSKMATEDQKFKVVTTRNGKQNTVKRFDTISEAEAYIAEKGTSEHSIVGGDKAHAVMLSFSDDLTGEKLDSLLRLLETKFGRKAGFTKMSDREVAIINFRDDETKIPFLDDKVFFDSLSSIKENLNSLGVTTVDQFYSEGEYGYVHDWEADNTGSAILDSDLLRKRSDIQERVHVWRNVFEELLKEFSGENLRNLEETLNNRGGVRGSGPEDSTGKGTKYRVGVATQTTESPFTVEPDGSVRLFHWGNQSGLTSLDPSKHGTGIRGAESKRRENDPKNYVPRIYFGMNEGGYVKEPRLSNNKYEASVKLDELYDFTSDPEGFLEKGYEKAGPYAHDDAITYAERLISEAGYKGLWVNTRRDQNRSVAVLFTPTEVKSVPYSEESTNPEGGTPKPTPKYRISDREYLSAVEAGDLKTAQRMVDEAAREAGFTYHRYKTGLPAVGVPWMMFTSDQQSVENAYGDRHYVASDQGAIDIEELIPDITDALEEYGSSQFIRDNAESIAEELNPENIVNSAGSWDDAEVVQDVWDRVLEDRGIFKVKTADGLMVMADQDYDGNGLVKSADPIVKDDQGNIIPLSERFNSKKSDIRYRIAFHGSPFRFARFSTKHIGTGEGYQAYGWGLYFAEKKSVAETYRKKLSTNRVEVLLNGKEMKLTNNTPPEVYDAYSLLRDSYVQKLAGTKDPAGIAKWAIQKFPPLRAGGEWILEHVKDGSLEVTTKNDGQLYEVDIPEDNELLDLDKPLKEQPKEVRDMVEKALAGFRKAQADRYFAIHGENTEESVMDIGEMTGNDVKADLYMELGDEKESSLYLKKFGIKGFKYFDAGSRSIGEGTHNFVVFDDNAIKMVKTYYRMRPGMVDSGHVVTTERLKESVPGAKVFKTPGKVSILKLKNGEFLAIDSNQEVPIGRSVRLSELGENITIKDIDSEFIEAIDASTFVAIVDGMTSPDEAPDGLFELGTHIGLTYEDVETIDKAIGGPDSQFKMYKEFLETGNAPAEVKPIFQALRDYYTKIRNKLFGNKSASVFKDIHLEGVMERFGLDEQKLSPRKRAEYRNRLNRDMETFSNRVDSYLKYVGMSTGDEGLVDVMTTPLALELVRKQMGLGDEKLLPIKIDFKKLGKILVGKHADSITPELLKQIPEKIADPIMILRLKPEGQRLDNSLLFVLGLQDKNGYTVNVAIAMDMTREGSEINEIKTVFGRGYETSGIAGGNKFFISEALWKDPRSGSLSLNSFRGENGWETKLKYIDTEQARMWADQYGLDTEIEHIFWLMNEHNNLHENRKVATQYDLEGARKKHGNTKYRTQPQAWENTVSKFGLEGKVDPLHKKQGVKDKIKGAWRWWKYEVLDRRLKIRDVFGNDIYMSVTNALDGISSKSEALITFGEKKKGVKSLYDIFGQVSKDEQDGFMHYAIYKHLQDIARNTEHAMVSADAIDLLVKEEMDKARAFEKITPADPIEKSNLDHNAKLHYENAELYRKQAEEVRKQIHDTRGKSDDYRMAVEELEKEYPHWVQAQKDLAKFSRYLLWKLKNSDIISDSLFNVLVTRYPNYVPLQRDFGEEGAMESFVKSRGIVNITSPLKKLKGSRRDVKDPLLQIVSNVYTFESLTARQDAGKRIVDMYDNGEFKDIIEEVGDKRGSPTEHVFHVWEGGKKRYFKTDADIYAGLMMNSKSGDQTGLMKILSAPVRALRAGVTHGVGFILRNPLRDTVNAGVVGENFVPIVDTLRGMFHIWKQDKIFEDFMKSGAAQGMAYMSSKTQEEMAKRIRIGRGSKRLMENLKPWNTPMAIWNFLGDVAQFTELGTRVGQYQAVKRKGGTDERAAYVARDLVNYQRSGNVSQAISKVNPFFNAQIQGVAKGLRSIYHDGKIDAKTLAKGLLYITLPSMLSVAWNLGDDDRKKKYLSIPNWQRNLFWNIVLGEGDDTWVLKIPKPFDLGVVFGSIPERFMDYLYAEDERAFNQMGESLVQAVSPETVPLFLGLPLELMTNYSLFFERNIVPMGQEKLEPRLQYGAYTAEWAKWAGDKFNISPRKLEYGVNQLTGNFGKEVSNLADKAFRLVSNETRPAREWYQEVPGVSAFAVPAKAMKRWEQTFRDERDELDVALRSAKEVLKTKGRKGLGVEDRRVLGAEGGISRINKYFTGKGGINEIYREINRITVAKGMSAEQKRRRVDALQRKVAQLSERGLKETERIKRVLNKK